MTEINRLVRHILSNNERLWFSFEEFDYKYVMTFEEREEIKLTALEKTTIDCREAHWELRLRTDLNHQIRIAYVVDSTRKNIVSFKEYFMPKRFKITNFCKRYHIPIKILLNCFVLHEI